MTAMDALLALEPSYLKAGKSLLPIFFPRELLPEEMEKLTEFDSNSMNGRTRVQEQGQANRDRKLRSHMLKRTRRVIDGEEDVSSENLAN
jgi:hypothetical protein